MSKSSGKVLAAGVVVIVGFLVVFHVDMVTRPGYDLLRNGPSQLMTGERGWLEIANFVITGLFVIASAVGLRGALGSGVAATWGPRLLAGVGFFMVCAGVFVTDPEKGYPPGTPGGLIAGDGAADTWHATLHTFSTVLLYASVCATALVVARRLAIEPSGRSYALPCRVLGLAAPAVLLVGVLVLPALGLQSADWYLLVDGILGRAVVPLGWLSIAVVLLGARRVLRP